MWYEKMTIKYTKDEEKQIIEILKEYIQEQDTDILEIWYMQIHKELTHRQRHKIIKEREEKFKDELEK